MNERLRRIHRSIEAAKQVSSYGIAEWIFHTELTLCEILFGPTTPNEDVDIDALRNELQKWFYGDE